MRGRTSRRAGSRLSKITAYCASRPGSAGTTPFGPEPLVFKVAGRMFALVGHLDGAEVVSLKCDPDRSAVLRTSFRAIVPGYHLNKQHWNTIILDGSVPAPLVLELIDHSYELASRGGRAGKRKPRARRSRAPRGGGRPSSSGRR